MWERTREILKKEFRQALRDPRMRLVLFLSPLLQLMIFGYAANLDVDNSPIAWLDGDNSPSSRELRAAFAGSRYFTITAALSSGEQARDLLDRGRVLAVVHVLSGFGEDILRGKRTSVQVLIDGTNSNTASIVSSHAGRLIAGYASEVSRRRLGARLVGRTMAAGGPVNLDLPIVELRSRVWFNEDLRSRNYFVPGVVVSIIALVTLMLTAMAIVREKEIGTMEQLMVTPIRPIELVLGKTIPFALIGLLDVALVTSVALLVFRVPFRGSGLLLAGGAVLFLLSTLGVGLLISTVSQTQQQAVMSSFFFFAPAFMLGGFAFPIRNMPLPAQYLTYLNPFRYFLEIVRGIFLKGAGVSVLWPQMAALLVLGVTILAVSALRFHKRLD